MRMHMAYSLLVVLLILPIAVWAQTADEGSEPNQIEESEDLTADLEAFLTDDPNPEDALRTVSEIGSTNNPATQNLAADVISRVIESTNPGGSNYDPPTTPEVPTTSPEPPQPRQPSENPFEDLRNGNLPEPDEAPESTNTLSEENVGKIPEVLIPLLSPEEIDSIADKLTILQARAIPLNVIPRLSPNTIRHIIGYLTVPQIQQLTPTQVQALSTEEIQKAVQTLVSGPLLEQFLTKLSDEQLIRYVNQVNPTTLPDSVLQRYARLIGPGIDIEIEERAEPEIEGTELTNNGITTDLETAEGDTDITVTEDGFTITSEEGGTIVVEHPLEADTEITFTLPEDSTIEVRLTDTLEFETKLSEFVNVEIAPPTGKITLYSKKTFATTTVNEHGEYKIENAIFTYENLLFKETIDADTETSLDLNLQAGIGCARLSQGANYTLQKEGKTHGVISDDPGAMVLCIRKGNFLQPEYFSRQEAGTTAAGLTYNLLDVVDYTTQWNTALRYKYNGDLVFQSRERVQSVNQNGQVHITKVVPKTIAYDGYFVIHEEHVRYFYFTPTHVPQYLTTYTTEHNAQVAITRDSPCSLQQSCTNAPARLIQTGSTSRVTAYDINTNAYQAVQDHFGTIYQGYEVFQ